MRKYDLASNYVIKSDEFKKRWDWLKGVNEESNGDVFELVVMPYGFRETIGEMTSQYDYYDDYTPSSKSIMFEEITGLVERVNRYIDYVSEPEVKVVLLIGNNVGDVVTVKKSVSDVYIQNGMAALA